jgi:two-component system alkaline phosphatase synthesis response regulator PhoP
VSETARFKRAKLLIVEDEPDLSRVLRDNFEQEGYDVVVAQDGDAGVEDALRLKPNLLLLDVMLPKRSGLDVCRELRQRGFRAPILMLTARGQEVDKIVGLELGADDYVTKPFSLRELLARVRAQLRGQARKDEEVTAAQFGDVEVNFTRHEARKAGIPIEMSPRELAILKYFVSRPGEIITRERLLNEVWGYDAFPFTRTVDNHIAKLRQKIEATPANPRYLITIHRVGYKFVP